MDGRTHRFLAFLISTLICGIFTSFHTNNFRVSMVNAFFLFMASTFYNKSSKWKEKKKEIDEEDSNKKKKASKKSNWWERGAWTLLFTAIMITIAYANFLPEGRSLSISMITISLFIVTFSGSTFPDWDWDWGQENHRSPLTHSWIIPFTIWIWGLIAIPFDFRYINIITAMFCLSYATHLFADCVKSGTHGIIHILKNFFNFHYSPGNIINVPPKKQHAWLFISASILCIAFGLTIPRIYGTLGFTWDISDPNDQSITILLIVCLLSISIWTILYVYMHFKSIEKSNVI